MIAFLYVTIKEEILRVDNRMCHALTSLSNLIMANLFRMKVKSEPSIMIQMLLLSMLMSRKGTQCGMNEASYVS